jgi:small conductance mechanosensitive channel
MSPLKMELSFSTGETKNHKFKDWAGDLASHTQDVAAVVNKIVVLEPSVVDLHMIMQELVSQGRKIIRALPGIIFGAIILLLAWFVARLVYKLVPIILRNKVNPSLLNEVIARAISFFVFLMGIYFIFEMADLTTMALTVLSGTGLLGIILGIAFRDLAENFLASILLSLQNPFHQNDLIDLVNPVSGYTITGTVERLTMRVTILVSPNGNHLQIPNATVYKSNIVNHTSNPNHREVFNVTIGNNCSVSKAVDLALKVLLENDAILKDPDPLVLVEGLGRETVRLEVSYWTDITKNNADKIKSTVIRLIKKTFQEQGIFQSESDMIDHKDPSQQSEKPEQHFEAKKAKSEMKTAEDVQVKEIKGLSDKSRPPEGGKNFLGNPGDKKDPNK